MSFANTLDDPTQPAAPTKPRRINPLTATSFDAVDAMPHPLTPNVSEPVPDLTSTVATTIGGTPFPGGNAAPKAGGDPVRPLRSAMAAPQDNSVLGDLGPGRLAANSVNSTKPAQAPDLPSNITDVNKQDPNGDGARQVAAMHMQQASLAPADMNSTEAAPRVNALREKLNDESNAPDWKHQLISAAERYAPMAIGAIGGPLGAAIGESIGAGIGNTQKRQADIQRDATQTQLGQAVQQQTNEFDTDARARAAALENSNENNRLAQTIRSGEVTKTATTYDKNGNPQEKQFNPDTQGYTTDIGGGKPLGPMFTVQRHPVTNEPIGIQRRTGVIISDESQMTPDEQAMFEKDKTAFGGGQDFKTAFQKQKDAAALQRAEIMSTRPTVNDRNKLSDTMYSDAIAATQQRQTMHKLLPEAQAGNAQADLALLMNHIGMTAVKGQRINRDTIREAAQAKGIGNGDAEWGMYQHLMSGQMLAPEQRNQMVDLADQMEVDKWNKADSMSGLVGAAPLPGRNQIGPPKQTLSAAASGTTVAPNANTPPAQTLTTGHKAGDIVSVKGQRIKITAVSPDGKTFDGVPVDANGKPIK